ncbi:adenosylhomocysteinase [Nocardia goodfellowii]|uniref:Adenosylhomocysteinase n=1 Tax=Nocardia goodfellowii TaxID=882446 RepID=A0ABS4QPP3_9NOCA|nr:adenosylhomocysteinase [Nocardia goodfellowii]MBP2193115.1 adenosylhomocysteinase [Nocardia goodfellowii]
MTTTENRAAAKVAWAQERMPVVAGFRRRFAAEHRMEGWRVAASLHLIATSVPLLLALIEAGAEVTVCGSNPASTDDDVVDWLSRREGIRVLTATEPDEAADQLADALAQRPHLIVDEADALLGLLYAHHADVIPGVRAASVHTLTGVLRVRSLAARGRLRFPVMAVDGSPIKQIFDNRLGTGQSTVDALLRTVNLAFPGRRVVVVGYGHVGRGVAERARGLGAEVVVTEVDPIRALTAALTGYRVLPMAEAAETGDVFITATGTIKVITAADLAAMRDGVILANAGHSAAEIDIQSLRAMSVAERDMLPMVTEFRDERGRRRYVLSEGGPVNTSAAAGHPPELMDLSFAAQAAGIEELVRHADRMEPRVYDLPPETQAAIAREKLAAMGIRIDHATAEQRRYTEQLSHETDQEFQRSLASTDGKETRC